MAKDIGAFNTFDFLTNKTLYKACGLSDDDLYRPIIGIANSYNEMVSGHINLRELAQQVKYGVYRAGGTLVFVRDGDTITVDVIKKRLEVNISDEEMQKRRSEWSYTPDDSMKGYLGRHAKLVSSANEGAVLK